MQKNTTIDTSSVHFTFTDNDGEVFASFKLNPTDPRLLKKCKEMADFFTSKSTHASDPLTFENTVEEMFCKFLGYDCRQSLFGRIAATDVMGDGNTFAAHVINTMIEHVGPEIKRRRAENLARYTAKYAE